MGPVPQVKSIQVEQDLAHQRLFWKIERAGWLLMVLLIGAALLGLSGAGGRLNQATARAEGVELEYQPFMRQLAPSQLTVRINRAAGDGFTFRLDRDYLSQLQIQAITPEPDSVTAVRDQLEFKFPADESSPLSVKLDIQPEAVGTVNGGIAHGDKHLDFKQVVYP
ncbi:hypothetical protein KY386_00310 [Candidatus Parcubacteria bacterium]|nr:hypothetical protein [Candidatus Parcubacteria bacterium]